MSLSGLVDSLGDARVACGVGVEVVRPVVELLEGALSKKVLIDRKRDGALRGGDLEDQ